MIHAYYCYDSDPIDRWFKEDIEITDEMYWDLEKYFYPDELKIHDDIYSWEFTKHFGGYDVTLGGPLNNPVTAVLNAYGEWHPDKESTFAIVDDLKIEVNGNVWFPVPTP